MGYGQILRSTCHLAEFSQEAHEVEEFGIGFADLLTFSGQGMQWGPLQSQFVDRVEQASLVHVVQESHDALDGGASLDQFCSGCGGQPLALPHQGHTGIDEDSVPLVGARLTLSSLQGCLDCLKGGRVKGQVDGGEGLLQLLLNHTHYIFIEVGDDV